MFCLSWLMHLYFLSIFPWNLHVVKRFLQVHHLASCPPDCVKSYSCEQNKKVSALAVPNRIKLGSRRADISCPTSVACIFSTSLPCTDHKNFNPCPKCFEIAMSKWWNDSYRFCNFNLWYLLSLAMLTVGDA